ncbi:phosphatase PAP2 family protein [Sporosarcina limicola]|uniref:Undecaprenyl-diphosphatase n=1 Tax=Sporosarcina limicola TaxID=34101 RepID=A0A927R1X0_9BACL|nr:phosphatase PAP2 family protein [Sporosarcina limicola]MBE1553246.1 undecaprenyl-diphosphatase [Sporosarcina limicola]
MAFILCIGLGVLFGYIVTGISNETILNFDNTIITFVQGLETPWLTVIMKGFTWVGSGYVVAPIALITICVLYFMLHYRHQAFLFVAVIGGTAVLNGLLKIYFKRERPEIHRIMEASGFSFPSGHTMMAFSLYAIIAYIAWRNVKTALSHILLFLFSAFMVIMIGTSRIYVGVHYPSDVLGGVAASALWVIVAISVYTWYQERWEKKFTS